MFKVSSEGPRRPTSSLYERAHEALVAFYELQCSGAVGIVIADCDDTPITEQQLSVLAMMDMMVGPKRPARP